MDRVRHISDGTGSRTALGGASAVVVLTVMSLSAAAFEPCVTQAPRQGERLAARQFSEAMAKAVQDLIGGRAAAVAAERSHPAEGAPSPTLSRRPDVAEFAPAGPGLLAKASLIDLPPPVA